MKQRISSRLTYLDGLRGFAALQVILLHYLGVFVPGASHAGFFKVHPAVLAWLDGGMSYFTAAGALSVSLFFLVSGTVLTFSFEEGRRSFTTQVVRRAIRLGVPAVASIILGIVCFSFLPRAHIQAAALMGGNQGVAMVGPNHIDIAAIANEIFMGSLLFGHAGATLLPHFAVRALGLLDLTHSFNAPLWTLHLEFYGSILVLILVTIKHQLSRSWRVGLCVALVLLLLANPIAMFVVGFAAARTLQSAAWARHTQQPWFKALAVICMLLGFGSLAETAPGWLIQWFTTYRDFIILPMQIDLVHGFGQYGGVLVFFGIIGLRLPQMLLASSFGRLLGRYSFSMYLVHFPILYTLGAGLFIMLRPYGLGVAISVSATISMVVTGVVIYFFERLVDQPAIAWSRRVNLRPLFKSKTVSQVAG